MKATQNRQHSRSFARTDKRAGENIPQEKASQAQPLQTVSIHKLNPYRQCQFTRSAENGPLSVTSE